MSNFSAKSSLAQKKMVIHDNATPNSGADGDVDDVMMVHSRPIFPLTQGRSGYRIIIQVGGLYLKTGGELVAEVQVIPAFYVGGGGSTSPAAGSICGRARQR